MDEGIGGDDDDGGEGVTRDIADTSALPDEKCFKQGDQRGHPRRHDETPGTVSDEYRLKGSGGSQLRGNSGSNKNRDGNRQVTYC